MDQGAHSVVVADYWHALIRVLGKVHSFQKALVNWYLYPVCLDVDILSIIDEGGTVEVVALDTEAIVLLAHIVPPVEVLNSEGLRGKCAVVIEDILVLAQR